ncbi:type VII secretion system-associated protein [Streptomyces sp. H27-D2]|uniref:type VII secretion system-associated protein n=1 Tax=Streptomyces sp. H27-D2 TaxID=3046304 RepID=UPI002DBDDE8D|nr:type VII secretion system-associated protein [Streptomyces sp. H27-D2]MEC4016751.1 type VII secretion system-associated protein [Streptomyces sp. H27-D2]
MYAIDPFFSPTGNIPPYGIIGAWKVDAHGQVTGEFKHNQGYRPSPRSIGLADPTDAVDSAIQLAATGYGNNSAVRVALLNSVVFLVPETNSGAAPSIEGIEGGITSVYTSEQHAPSSAPRLRRIDFRILLAELPDCSILKLNPGSSTSVQLPIADMRRAAGL